MDNPRPEPQGLRRLEALDTPLEYQSRNAKPQSLFGEVRVKGAAVLDQSPVDQGI